MPDGVLIGVIGTAGTIFGAVATVVINRARGARSARSARSARAESAEAPVFGEVVDIRELRILRALVGEPSGRLLEAYQCRYYRGALDSVIRRGWVKRIEHRYHLTQKGAEFCRAYLKQTLGYEPSIDRVLA